MGWKSAVANARSPPCASVSGRACRWRSRKSRRFGAAMDEAIRFILGNFTLTFLVIGLAAWLVSLLRTSKPRTLATVIRSAVLLFPDVLDRLQLSLQLHPAHFIPAAHDRLGSPFQ